MRHSIHRVLLNGSQHHYCISFQYFSYLQGPIFMYKSKNLTKTKTIMYFSGKGASNGHQKYRDAKANSLNPNAQEFVPFSVKSSAASNSSTDAPSRFLTSVDATNTVYDRSESLVSNNSDEEAHQYWQHQLPDDITPDFKVTSIDDVQGIETVPFSRLSLTDVNKSAVYSPSRGHGLAMMDHQGLSLHLTNGNSFCEKIRHPAPSYREYPSPPSIQTSFSKPWHKKIIANDQFPSREVPPYNVKFRRGCLMDLSNKSNKQLLGDRTGVNPFELLASEFPGFAAETIAEAYFSSGGDLSLTIEMLAQLQLQVHGVNQSMNAMALSAPNLSALDFHAPSMTGSRNRSTVNENAHAHRFSTSVSSSGTWRYGMNGSSETITPSSRSPQALISSFGGSLLGEGRAIFSDRVQNHGSAQAAPKWLGTGEGSGNMRFEMREDELDYTHMRDSYLEQAQQALLTGKQAQAKELSYKGQPHNMHMKQAHAKLQEPIFHPRHEACVSCRNSEVHAYGRERMIDLHGLNASEAVHTLKRDLAVVKKAARSSDQCMLAYIYVGTGQQARAQHSSTMLPTAVQRCLLEEGLDYSEPQPGLLRVVVFC